MAWVLSSCDAERRMEPTHSRPGLKGEGRAKRPYSGAWRIALAVVLVVLAAVYMVWALDRGWNELRSAAYSLTTSGSAMLVLGSTLTLLLAVAYHVVLLSEIQPHRARPSRVALAYSLGQVVRYVPGKVVGIVFQVGFLQGAVGTGSILAALLVQTLHEYAWTMVFCASLLGALVTGEIYPLLLLPVAVAGLHLVHRSGVTWRVLPRVPWLGRHVPRLPSGSPTKSPLVLTILQVIVWIPMLAAMWLVFEPLLGTEASLIAALAYIAAAVVSLLIFVVPSGLVVREAAYVWLGGLAALPPGKLLFIALVMRVSLTVAELATALLLAAIDRLADGQEDEHDG